MSSTSDLDDLAIANFRDYLRIPTVSETTDYEDCVQFLQNIAACIQLECTVIRMKPNRPVVVMKYPGKAPCLPAIALSSHMDVVPVEEDKWEHPPFEAYMDETGKIYGRGAQDMKMVGIQYLEAVRRMKRDGVCLCRTIVILFLPDGELGGQEGMKMFVQRPEFCCLNIGFCLDESIASTCPRGFILFYAEKHKWSVNFHVPGDAGHSSFNIPNTACEKLAKLLNIIYTFRNEQYEQSEKRPGCPDHISINATVIKGGVQENIIPSEFVVTVDARLPPQVDIERWKKTLSEWCNSAGDGVRYEESLCEMVDKPTAIDSTNPYFQTIVDTIREMGFEVSPTICVGATNSRYMRNKGIPAFGFSSLNGMPLLVHGHNEYIDKERFLLGINIYQRLLPKLGNLSG